MQPRENGQRDDTADPLTGARNWCIFGASPAPDVGHQPMLIG